MTRPLLRLLVLTLAACGGGSSTPMDGGTEPDAALEASAGAQDAAATDATAADAHTSEAGAADAMAAGEIDRVVREAIAREGFSGLGVVVRDAADRVVFQAAYGDFALDRTIGVASASKMVSGIVILELVKRGLITLDTTTGTVLGWTGDKAAINLRHLLSFTSGLRPENACTFQPLTTLAACVDDIRDADPLAMPAQRFDYGGTHLHVAGRMAEVAGGKGWNQLFDEILVKPLKLADETRYVTLPRQGVGLTNPLIAGGLRITTLDYLEVLALYFHKGRYRGLEVATPALFDAAAREPFPDVTIGTSPASTAGRDFRYGLASWVECAPGATSSCPVVSSPGAFGFTPWVDREAGYYAIVAMELSNAMGGVVKASIDLQQALKPVIAAMVAR